jgi:hypothetical protein
MIQFKRFDGFLRWEITDKGTSVHVGYVEWNRRWRLWVRHGRVGPDFKRFQLAIGPLRLTLWKRAK